MMTAAIRDLHLTYPGEYLTAVRSPCEDVFKHNPYLSPIHDDDGEKIDMQYPLIHESGSTGRYFSEGHREYLAEQIGRPIKNHGLRAEIYLDPSEMNWPNPVMTEYGYDGPYWVINAGVKGDFTLKQYPYYQEVVDLLRGEIQFVQVGHDSHSHPPLHGVLDMRGRTNLRQLFRLSQKAEGAVCTVSLQMVVMGAFRNRCVVVAGGREGVRWQLIPGHRYLETIGCLPCCEFDGCWKSKVPDCLNWIPDEGTSKCMQMIRPERVAAEVMSYYEGGVLKRQPEEMLCQT
jgi:ADP-heptose:LPS heptosyltransferase